MGASFKLFVTDESKPVFDKFFKKVFARNGKGSCEVRLGYENRPLRLVYAEGIVLSDDNKCLLSLVDISAFKKK